MQYDLTKDEKFMKENNVPTKKAIMCGPKKQPTTTDLYVVVVCNESLSTVVVGYFATEAAAERFAKKENERRPMWTFLALPVHPPREWRKDRYAA